MQALPGAFAANYMPSAIDPVIQGFTQSAAQIIDPGYQVNVLCNYFYAFASTFIVIGACWWVTEKITNPWLWKACPIDEDLDLGNENNSSITPSENRAFKIATAVLLLMLTGLAAHCIRQILSCVLLMALLPAFKAPIMQSIVFADFYFCSFGWLSIWYFPRQIQIT